MQCIAWVYTDRLKRLNLWVISIYSSNLYLFSIPITFYFCVKVSPVLGFHFPHLNKNVSYKEQAVGNLNPSSSPD